MRALPTLFLALIVLAGCATDAPVESLDGGSSVPTDFALREATGARDGARTAATFVFDAPDGRTLRLDLTLGYDPQPELVAGSWTLGDDGGTVHAEAVRFVGGQGEGPSVGGVYRLDDGQVSRFRVRLPLTRVGGGWSP